MKDFCMPGGPIDPSTLEGDDLVQWYRRSPWQVDQERQEASARQYADFFGGMQDPEADPDLTSPQSRDQTPAFGLDSLYSSQSPGPDPDSVSGSPDAAWRSTVDKFMGSPSGIAVAQQSAADSSPVSATPSGNSGGSPNAGILGALFPWAVPKPGGRSLKSAMVTPGGMSVGLDPSKVHVFQRGPDGKLHPTPGWRTTGPFEFGNWAQAFDGSGISHDLGHIADDVSKVIFAKAAGENFLEALGPNVKWAVDRAIFGAGQGHHSVPKFLGGPADQELVDLAEGIHGKFHQALTSELRAAGSPPVGGKKGATEIWQEIFEQHPATRDRALEILRRVTRDFDIERGTSITPHLDKELAKMKVNPPPPLN
ncbi:MAG: hypothetical protein JSR98_22165 [Proteobacteria bacterium]|nr:hypothetical protein [Pseudomonadota bacterium]